MPNTLAYAALIAWPFVALWLYLSRPVGVATIWTIVAGYLLLPVGTFFKIEMVPTFDKVSIPNICAFVGCLAFSQRAPRLLRHRTGVAEVLLLACVAGPFLTSVLNSDDIRVGDKIIPGVGAYDGFSAFELQLITLIPFLISRAILRNASGIRDLLRVLSIAGLVYSVLLLFEIRFSPQLHFWVYGYYPSDFIQTMRGDGSFRPMAFTGHGLTAAFFAMTAASASAAFWRARIPLVTFVPNGFWTVYLTGVLALCKSAAALTYGIVLVPLIRWGKANLQMRIAALLVVTALFYPALRYFNIFPTNTLVEIAEAISPDRAGSLQFRFAQEDQLLERASQRILFGWGRYGRSRVFRELEWGGAGDASVTDGLWVILLGTYGLVGFVGQFGLLAFSAFRASAAARFAGSRADSIFIRAGALIVSINMIELLPNSTLTPWSWLLAGALLGRSEVILARLHRSASPIPTAVALKNN
jgi:hypothetical protein